MIKKVYRLIRYKGERIKTASYWLISNQQNKLLKQEYNSLAKKIIVVIVDGTDYATGKEKMSGGIISIISICETSKKLLQNNDTQVICCTLNQEGLLLKYNNFFNTTTIFRFEQLRSFFVNIQEIIIHIPEYLTAFFISSLTAKDEVFFKRIRARHFNILNQNINLMPNIEVVQQLQKLATLTTITTAHNQYCNQYYREKYNIPLHKLSVWISPEKYTFVEEKDKENLLVYSPDNVLDKQKIIQKLQQIEGLQLYQIQNITYEEYKQVIGRAKWSITFGEGLDGYFIEPIFSGAISFAVYNSHFFTHSFKNCKTIYNSYEEMYNCIIDDIIKLGNNENYVAYQRQQYQQCAALYNSKEYEKNIELFYNHQFTFA